MSTVITAGARTPNRKLVGPLVVARPPLTSGPLRVLVRVCVKEKAGIGKLLAADWGAATQAFEHGEGGPSH